VEALWTGRTVWESPIECLMERTSGTWRRLFAQKAPGHRRAFGAETLGAGEAVEVRFAIPSPSS
jgi:hypothetical protein